MFKWCLFMEDEMMKSEYHEISVKCRAKMKMIIQVERELLLRTSHRNKRERQSTRNPSTRGRCCKSTPARAHLHLTGTPPSIHLYAIGSLCAAMAPYTPYIRRNSIVDTHITSCQVFKANLCTHPNSFQSDLTELNRSNER